MTDMAPTWFLCTSFLSLLVIPPDTRWPCIWPDLLPDLGGRNGPRWRPWQRSSPVALLGRGVVVAPSALSAHPGPPGRAHRALQPRHGQSTPGCSRGVFEEPGGWACSRQKTCSGPSISRRSKESVCLGSSPFTGRVPGTLRLLSEGKPS